MELRKCHLFFKCDTMKFFSFLLFLFLLFDSFQGSTIPHKRSIRALNTTLETNFNGTYERRNPCTNAEIETTSYVASHEFHHHTEENSWNDYTNKCSSIISSFLRALGNLVCFNHKQNGVFNFHINTSISQKQDEYCESNIQKSCDSFPTITIETYGCELSPKSSSGNLSGEQLCQEQNEDIENAICEDSLKEEICQRNEAPSGKAPKTHNFNQNSAINTVQYPTGDEIAPIPYLGATAIEPGAELLEAENAWALDDTFLPATETDTSLEPESSTASSLMETENSPEGIIDPSENAQANFQTKQYPDFFEPSATLTPHFDSENYSPSQRTEPRKLVDSSHSQHLPQISYFGHKTTSQPITDEEPFYSNEFSDLSFKKKQPAAYSKQLFYDNLDKQVPDSEFSPNRQPDSSFFFLENIAKAPSPAQESIPSETLQSKSMALVVDPSSLQQQFPVAIGRKEESFQQLLQNGKLFDSFEKIQARSNTDISSENETTSYPSQKYLTEYEETPFSQLANAESPQLSNPTSNERQFEDYDSQTPALGFSASYSTSPAQVLPMPNTPGNTLPDRNWQQKITEKRAQEIDYPGELFKALPAPEDNLGSVALDDTSSNNNEGVPFLDNLSAFNIGKPLTDPAINNPSNERSPAKQSFYDVNDNQFLSTPSPERLPFYLTNESPLLTSESQKSASYYSKENSDESNTDKVTDAELPSNQYQSTARPESQSLLSYPNQYGNAEKVRLIPESTFSDPFVQPDSELATFSKSYLQSYSTTPESRASGFIPLGERPSSFRHLIDSTPNQKFFSSYDSTSDYESVSSSEGETFSDEYLTTLPPDQDFFEKSQQILTTFDPDQEKPTPFPSALVGKFTPISPGQTLNDDAMLFTRDESTPNSKQSSNDIYTSRTPAPTSFDDYQDSLYPKPDIKPSFTATMQHFNEYNYEPATEPYFTNDKKTCSDESQSTPSSGFSTDQLKQKPYSDQNSDLTLEQSLKYSSSTPLPARKYDSPKWQSHQLFEKSGDSLSDGKPFSDQQYNDFSTESSETEDFVDYDSEVPSESFAPQIKQHPDDNVHISNQSKQNLDITPYFAGNFPEKNRKTFSPQQSFMPYNNEELFSDRSLFGNLEITPSPDFSTSDFSNAEDCSEPITANNDQKLDFPVKFPKDSDTRPEKFSPGLFTTPLPPIGFPSEDFSSPSDYKTMSRNPLTPIQEQESLAALEQSVGGDFSPKTEEPAFSSPFRNVNEFDSDFQNEKNTKQSFESTTAEEEPIYSTTPDYESQSNQPFSYFDATESFNRYAEEQYVAADPSKVQPVFFPEQKSFPKPLISDWSEYESTTSSEHQSTEEPAESELYNYSISDSDYSGDHPAVDLQTRGITNQESTQNHPDRFSDFYLKEPSGDFFPSVERPLIRNSPDSPKEQTDFSFNNRQPSSVVFEPQSLISTAGNDQYRSLEFQSSSPKSQLESVPSFSDDEPLTTFSENTRLNIPSQINFLPFTKKQEVQSNEFQTLDSLAFAPYNQPQKVTSVTSYPPEGFLENSQNSSIEDLESAIPPESHFTKPEINRNINRASSRQTAAGFNTIQSRQEGPETYKQFPSTTPLQHAADDQYKSKPSSQTLFEEYSDIIPKVATETPFDVDETTALSVPKVSPLHLNEPTESQYNQEKISDFSSSFVPEEQSYDYLPEFPDENIAEKSVLLGPQNSNSEVRSAKSIARDSYPVYTGVYEEDTASTDYNQPKFQGLERLDESSDVNFDLSNPTQASSPPSDSVLNTESRSNDFTSFPQIPVSKSIQLNNNANDLSQQSSAISLRYPQSEKEVSFVTDNVSPQSRPKTAVYNDEEVAEIFPTSKPQLQTSLDFAEKFSDDISHRISNLPEQQYQITPDAALSSELEPVPSMNFLPVSTQRNTADFGTFDDDANHPPSLLFQSQTQPLNVMTDSSDQAQNNFDPKLSSQISNASPLYRATGIQSQREPTVINPEQFYSTQERIPPHDQPEFQPVMDSKNRQMYQQDRPIHPAVYNRFPSNISPREPKNFNEAFPYPEAKIASRYGQQVSGPREKFQTQPFIPRTSRYPINAFPKNRDTNRYPSVASRHSATQRFDPQSYPANFPNQYPNYNARERLNVPGNNFYNNELARQTNRASSQYFTSDAVQARNSFENPLPFNLDQYSKRSEVEQSPDQTIKNADSLSYDDYDQALSSQSPNEKLLEYDENITSKLYAENSQMDQIHRQQGRNIIEEESAEDSDIFLTEADSPLRFSQKADPYDFQDRSSPSNERPSFPSSLAEKEPHSNPLFQTLKSHLTFPFQEQLHPSASFPDTKKETLNDSFSFDPQNQVELNFSNHQRSQPLSGVATAQDVTNTRQSESQVLVSDPNIPSNIPGEDCISYSRQNPTSLLCPFDPILKGNMTAPSYYILISKQPVGDDKEEQFKVEKVYLGDGMPLNCALSDGKTFPTSLYTLVPFSAAGTVKLRTKSDFA